MDGARDSAQAVKDANKTPSGTDSGHHEFTLDAGATNAEILAEADALSTHSITTGSRYIDASGEVHNFRSGKRTYWLITKSEVNVVEPEPDPDPQDVAGNLTLTGTIAYQELTQGTLHTSAMAFPAGTSADGNITYSVANLPTGIMLNSDRKLTGTTQEVLAETQLTYTAVDTDDTATMTFNLSVKPSNPELSAGLTSTGVELSWDINSGVDGWESQVNSGPWRAFPCDEEKNPRCNSGETSSYTFQGLAPGETYTYKVRSFIGSGDSRVHSDASNEESVTTPEIFTDMEYTQGELVVMRLPVPDDPNDPDYPYQHRYYISPAPPEGIVFDNVPRMIGWAGVPDKHMAKTSYHYYVREENYGKITNRYTFTAGVKPMKPAGFTATAGDTEAALSWNVIAGVSGWEYSSNDGDTWTDISGSGATTNGHNVTSLTNATEYTFKVRAFIGTGDTRVNGVESDDAKVTPTS